MQLTVEAGYEQERVGRQAESRVESQEYTDDAGSNFEAFDAGISWCPSRLKMTVPTAVRRLMMAVFRLSDGGCP